MLRTVLVLGALTALPPLTIDMYLPAFPSISSDLAASESFVQLTLTGTLIGVALGQLIIGPTSDRLGRRRPLIAAVVLHVVASVLCAVAPNVAALGALRVLQGMAAAAGAVVSMAVVRDMYTGLPAVRMLSRLMLVMGVAPVLAPTLGGQVLRFTTWRGVFWTLALVGAALIAVVVIGLRETLPPENRHGGMRESVRAYGPILRDRTFVGLMLTGGLMMAALFAYVSGSSFVFQDVYGLSEQQFAVMFGVNSVGLITATQINPRAVRRFGPQRVLAVAVPAAAAICLVMFAMAATGTFGLPGVAVPLVFMLATIGFTLPNIPALALAEHGRSAGTAASLLGSMNFGLGAVIAPVVGAFDAGSAAPMAGVMAAMAMLAVLVVFVVVRPGRLVNPYQTSAGEQPAATMELEPSPAGTDPSDGRTGQAARGRR
ncbi:Bcr/CflA family multidrug efflux MFS transporter [Phytoactinopolyspora halotolerans]|uniref:Bcr/CflA family multidrug efflux MFS transporter n=1 Tax=Phytoactinopolyspora halotolerans TaxID=1981512 RepID=A0A6L9S5U1_9ACTN|nr:Bcr/CflA family multidrug efflux MFS transporter [Phytoactinopolyspora halotolerans]NEE00014.1 Bcr/CflA family multidrug efflux MFS transporter [Phytoactinopolyspora halotolerans]